MLRRSGAVAVGTFATDPGGYRRERIRLVPAVGSVGADRPGIAKVNEFPRC